MTSSAGFRFGENGVDAAYLQRLFTQVQAGTPQSYIRLLQVIRLVYATDLPDELASQAKLVITTFNYQLDPSVKDAQQIADDFSEHRQLVFAAMETLAGQLYPDAQFGQLHDSGTKHEAHGQHQLRVWLSDRFRFGFSEWLDTTALAIDVAALTMLVDHLTNETLAIRAAIVLDLVLADIAIHSFEHSLAAASSTSRGNDHRRPQDSLVAQLLDAIINPASFKVDPSQLSSIFATRIKYQIPEVVTHLASCDHDRQVFISQGLDVSEVAHQLQTHPDYPRTSRQEITRFLSAMNALSHPKAPSSTLSKVFRLGAKQVNSGQAWQRANIQTFRTKNYFLSSAQRYHPGEYGGAQHLWQARLRGGINVFANHPHSPSSSEHYWQGNAINPDIAQRGNLLLAISALGVRPGFHEGSRARFTHFFFPFVDFDETRIGSRWVIGRKGDAYIAILGTNRLDQVSETEIIQRGSWSGYGVYLTNDEEFASLHSFAQMIRQTSLELDADTLHLSMPFEDYSLVWKGAFKSMGVEIKDDYERQETNMTLVKRNPRRISFQTVSGDLVLDWNAPSRSI